MSNGLRHFLGLPIAVVVTPVFAAGLAWAPHWAQRAGSGYDPTAVPGVPPWVPLVAVLAVLGLLLGLVAGSRVSPVAALLSGLALGAAGVLETAALPMPDIATVLALRPGSGGGTPWFEWGPLFTVVGTALFCSALPPSRWRGRDRGDEAAIAYQGSYGGDRGGYEQAGAPAASPATPPQGTPATTWDADGMPPRYHVPEPPGSGPRAAGWNDRRPGAGGGTGYPSPPG
ncbi:hypothetical protein GCM10027570_36000 [Streptomonospora sediminis]